MQLTSTRTFTIPDDVLNEIACDLITAAVEGGINYWASVTQYRWGDSTLGHSHDQANGSTAWQEGDSRYATVKIHDDEENVWHPVDAAKMIGAIQKLLSGEVKEFYTHGYDSTYRDRLIAALSQVERGTSLDATDYDFDASDGDCMIQIACLGEVVYG